MDTKIRYNSLQKDPLVSIRLETEDDAWIGLSDSDTYIEASSYTTFYLSYRKENGIEDIKYGQPYVFILNPDSNYFMSFTFDNPEDGPLSILWAGSGPSKSINDDDVNISYEINFNAEDGETYSYAEMQLIKYGCDLPWFGVLTYYK